MQSGGTPGQGLRNAGANRRELTKKINKIYPTGGSVAPCYNFQKTYMKWDEILLKNWTCMHNAIKPQASSGKSGNNPMEGKTNGDITRNLLSIPSRLNSIDLPE